MRKFLTILLSLSFLSFALHSSPARAAELVIAGPAGKIHGADISRWQHPNDKPINFKKMRAAGIDFVMIKASDTREYSDRLALKYVKADRAGAQEAGIHTGFYHYALLPNVTTSAAVQRDARVQAQKVIWRVEALGGFNDLDLPYALDLENNCVKVSSSGSCSKSATRAQATLWSKTFLATLKDKTGRTPLIYSSPHFLENALNRDKELSQYPLWIAQYAIDPAKAEARPNVKPGGCYVHSWTTAQCLANWTMWQYTSCGIAPKYGVPGNRLDLNVFGGTPEKFESLLTGTWLPDPADLMPVGESSTITISSVKATTTNKSAVIAIEVTRPDSSPVVTGSVKLYFTSANATKPTVEQKLVRETSGSWTLSITGLPAGTWFGSVAYKDPSGTHADAKTRVDLTITQGEAPVPEETKKAPSKPAADSCRNQIKN
ncbi:MAG: lysozyme M1 (1,4-beta-N-acetylmuramidase) [Candidatus Planktophila sp.]|nr:lysozyme M1 (1,4-beta-N-acetylmuramidase) [Candidatus Planktophila sp.]MSO25037.1 lysozyme M1 (1,4-beta-N-acetylmuramidase) [Candidatus Planktophila sp.]PHX69494.1 MAG: lysozyme M1 (1,4-beta-N-acetylmuramidase) [Actinomycetota bacterium]